MAEPRGNPSAEAIGLAALEARVRRDLEILDYPKAEWVPPTPHSSGAHVYDVAIVGAGQSGLAIAFALRREKIGNVLVVDRAPAGREGPWVTFARMRALRTPKYLTGPDLGIPSLTFRSWYEAQPHLPPWDGVVRIPRAAWMDYLRWYRRLLDLPVDNEVEVRSVIPEVPGVLRLAVRRAGREQAILARKVVFANGMDGGGEWFVPPEIAALPRRLYAHSAEDIDFVALAGKRIGVLGIGASAPDNAAVALEHGAARVDVFCRRSEVPKSEMRGWIENNGFLRHFFELDDDRRWRIMRRFWETGAPAPPWSLERAASHPGFHLHVATPWLGVAAEGEEVVVGTPQATHRFDFVIVATGLVVDLSRRLEFAAIAGEVATWGDRYTPPSGEECEPLAACPYLGPAYELTARRPGEAPYLRDVHLFNWGATPSCGISASSITGMKFGVPRLVTGITRDFYFAAADAHAASFKRGESRLE
ncbi:MAG: FAD/NAD(P)-binding protein [Pseudomonadota bacterium]